MGRDARDLGLIQGEETMKQEIADVVDGLFAIGRALIRIAEAIETFPAPEK